ncbi:probable Bax inhibitor 1 [Clytia hemisphaerica]|uniref:probable Bax inhibitor 1 n=1 Tax=Clytia hemisphaerica TaxID=252671 RepID=UPI0034D4D7B3
MDAFFGERSISLSALTDFSKLDVSTKKHLKNVYGALSLSMLSASVGAGLHLYSGLNLGILALLGGIGFMLGLAFTPNESKNQMTRLGCLLGFAGCTG